jgi:membrane-associated phospholipid phosphatase
MARPLIEDRWRRPVAMVMVAAAVVTAALAVVAFHATTNRFDTWVFTEVVTHLGSAGRYALLDLSTPALAFGLLAGVAVIAGVTRRWDVAVLAVIGPSLALGMTELVLKPLIGRILGPHVLAGSTVGAVTGSFPSGHETGVASAALVLLLGSSQTRLRAPARTSIGLVLALWVVLAAIGLVQNFYHYGTDTIGALGVSTVMVLASALAIDRWLPRRPPGDR